MAPTERRFTFLVLLACAACGCSLDRSALPPHEPRFDAGERDAGRDAGAVDSGPRDGGRDAGTDAGRDAGADSGVDAGPDAGPPVLNVTAGLFIHLDARDVNGDGSPALAIPTTWVDLTGSPDATCTDVTFEPDGLAPGRPAVFTNGNAGSQCWFRIPDLTDVTVFVVLRTSDTRTDSDWRRVPVIVGGDRHFTDEDGALYLAGGRPGFARGGSGLQVQSSTSIADDAPHVVGLVRTSSSGTVRLLVDSSSAEVGIAEGGVITAPNLWWLASHETASDGRFAARYAEVLVYDRALSDAEADEVRAYLQERWGL